MVGKIRISETSRTHPALQDEVVLIEAGHFFQGSFFGIVKIVNTLEEELFNL